MKRTTTLILLTLAVATATLLAAERSTIQYKGMSVREPAPYGEAGLAWQNNFKALADRIGPCKFDATTAPTAGDDTTAGYSTGSLWYDTTTNRLYWCASAATGAATWIEVSPADLSQVYQPLDANLTTWAGVAPSANGRAIVSAADYAAMRGLLGLVAGVDVQSHSANLDTWSSIAPSANGQSLVSAGSYAAMRGLLDLEPGTDVQAYSSRLGAIAALTPTDGNLIVGNGTTWVTQSGETARTTLGLGTMATQEAGSVAITGGSITGITDLAVADGGTGASDAAGARTNLGLGSIATQAANAVAITGGAINGTAIGATTPGTGSFTTLGASGNIDLPETSSSTVGVLKLGNLLIHGFRHPTGDTARPDGNNVFIGKLAGNFTMGATATSTYHASSNTGIGYLVLNNLTTGYSNVAIGDRALYAATEGNENMALGRLALMALTTGSSNVGLGYYAGRYTVGSGDNQTTSNSTYIGTATRAFADGVTNETVIGYSAVGKGSNTVQIGSSSVTDTYLSGWLNLPSDAKGLKLDAAGTTTLISNGTTATLSKPLKAAGYQASDGSAGINQAIAITDKSDVTHTMTFKDGLLTSYTTAP